MSGLFEQLVNHLVERLDPSVIGPARPPVIGPARPTTVEAPYRQAWDEKRWRQVQSGGVSEIVGPYRVFDRRRRSWREFSGRLVQDGRHVSAYIADPPPELQRHRHGPCLQLVRAPWFRLHWAREPKTLDHGLLYMERMLDEAINA